MYRFRNERVANFSFVVNIAAKKLWGLAVSSPLGVLLSKMLISQQCHFVVTISFFFFYDCITAFLYHSIHSSHRGCHIDVYGRQWKECGMSNWIIVVLPHAPLKLYAIMVLMASHEYIIYALPNMKGNNRYSFHAS